MTFDTKIRCDCSFIFFFLFCFFVSIITSKCTVPTILLELIGVAYAYQYSPLSLHAEKKDALKHTK